MNGSYKIKLTLYQKPKISNDPNHHINFLDENDKYNPFFKGNILCKSYKKSNAKDKNLIDFLIKDLMLIDLVLYENITLNAYNDIMFNKLLLDLIWDEVQKNNLWHNSIYVKAEFSPKKIKSILLCELMMLQFGSHAIKEKDACYLNVIRFYDCRRKDIVEVA